jgi:shikimate kinase
VSDALAMIGFMGAGKTTVAAAVGSLLHLPVVDTDAVIEASYGPIAEIFAGAGEAGFRALEHDVVCNVLDDATVRPAVIALGGGAVTIDDVREALQRLAHVVWIDAPVDLLFERAAAGGRRPLARDRAAFEALLVERRPLYRQLATTTVTITRDEPAQAIAGRIVEVFA